MGDRLNKQVKYVIQQAVSVNQRNKSGNGKRRAGMQIKLRDRADSI